MENQVAVVEPVLASPEITSVGTTSVVNLSVAPEPDILTRVSQFKLPEIQDKIENPPDQPEFANITDPIAKKSAAEAVERMRRGLQSSYDKKLQDAQALVNQSKSWTPQRIQQELLTNPEFVSSAQMINDQVNNSNDRELTKEEYSSLTNNEKEKLNTVTKLEQELNNIKQQANNDQIRTAITQKDLTLRGKFSDYDSKTIDEACVELGKLNLADVREYVYKATNYENNVKKAYEMGKLEGQGKLQTKINTIMPQGSTVVNNEGIPTKQTGENDKAFFVRLGQFRLNQFKTQK